MLFTFFSKFNFNISFERETFYVNTIKIKVNNI